MAEVREKNEEALLHLEGVTGIASSFRMRKGQLTAEPCLTALVEKKLPTPPKGAKVPQEIDAVKTDVVETGKIEALHFTYGVRPARPGFSIGHHLITAGTFGALVQDKENHDILILSNNHVLARSDLASIGDPVLQPGPYDGGTYPLHQIATLTKMVPLSRNWNNVDAAVAKPTEMRNVIASAIYLGIPTGVGQAYRGWWAKKVGRTTQYTIGYIYSTDAAIWVYGYPFGPALFRDQIWTTGMLAGGDSGSLLRDYYYNRAIGLSFAGSYYYSFHNNIANVLMSLGVDMVTAL
ncbi:MAG: hypothetical protein JSU77_03685 [Fidelibacterota bacterium]|nr:MAG: hypothetical protein JSU77_03685 [Candidatus Neomarinimicrobiota bacterium]